MSCSIFAFSCMVESISTIALTICISKGGVVSTTLVAVSVGALLGAFHYTCVYGSMKLALIDWGLWTWDQ